jgi:hypothetical protein
VLARDRVLAVPGPLGAVVPGGALQRGAVVSVGGAPGAGATSLALGLAAAATAAGEWAVALDRAGTLGGLAAREAGVELSRFAVVRDVPNARWSTVVLVMVSVPASASASIPAWPGDTTLRLWAEGGTWTGLHVGRGVLAPRAARVRVEGRGVAAGVRTLDPVLAHAG